MIDALRQCPYSSDCKGIPATSGCYKKGPPYTDPLAMNPLALTDMICNDHFLAMKGWYLLATVNSKLLLLIGAMCLLNHKKLNQLIM